MRSSDHLVIARTGSPGERRAADANEGAALTAQCIPLLVATQVTS